MVRYIIVLLILIISYDASAFNCGENLNIFFWAPRPGVTVNSGVIAVRGFLCSESPLLLIKNLTTQKTQVIETSRQCRGDSCVSTFAALIRNLAPGTNRLSASTPDGGIAVSLEVLRSALAYQD